jgi:hypothetical protein
MTAHEEHLQTYSGRPSIDQQHCDAAGPVAARLERRRGRTLDGPPDRRPSEQQRDGRECGDD